MARPDPPLTSLDDGGRAEEPDADELNLAGPSRRFLGAVVDGLVLAPVTVALSLAAGSVGGPGPVLLRLLAEAIVSAYTIVLTARWGRTVGKLVAGTRVVDERTGAGPGWRPSVVRWAFVSGPDLVALPLRQTEAWWVMVMAVGLFLYAVVVYSGILWDRRRQGLHDKAAHTLVVLAEREASNGEAVTATG